MFFFERCYDIDTLLRRNMHIHTCAGSLCAQPNMTLETVVQEAERCGLTDIAMVDHSDIWAHRMVLEENKKMKARRDAMDTPVKIRIGSEISLYGLGKYSMTPEEMEQLEYRLFAQNHYHVPGWEQPASHPEDMASYIQHGIACMKELFATGQADCMAHPLAPVKMDRSMWYEGAISDRDLGDIMELGEKAGCAWELHRYCVIGFPEFARRYFAIGREVGVHFNVGSDAHCLQDIDPAPVAADYKRILL